MKTLLNVSIALPCVMMLAMATGSALMAQDDAPRQRERIGEVLGKPVYRDEIRIGENVSLVAELHRLFTSAPIQKYRQAQKKNTTPTPLEVSLATKYFDNQHRKRMKDQEPALRARLKTIEEKLAGAGLTEEELEKLVIDKRVVESQLNPPGKSFAGWMMENWKFQRHLYDEYGGGRILWQQAGLEAFDATRKWLEALEQRGDFTITDPTLRSALYEYWTEQDHGSFMIEDEQRIRLEFLEPDWLKKP